MAKAKKSAQRSRLEKFWAENGVELGSTGLPIIAGGDEGLQLAGVTGEISNPGAGAAGNNVFELWPQSALTDIVVRSLETAWETIPHIGASIAPLVSVYDRQIRREVAEVAPFGIGQFRAPDATPSIYNPKIGYSQETVELLLLDEMTEIKEDLYIRMTSDVPAIRARAGIELATIGRILQIRHERLTEAMRWQVFKGNPLIVNYSGGQKQEIKYNYLESHKPSASVPWTDTINATPITDMRAWQTIIANSVGVYGSRFHMNSQTFQYLQRSNQVRGYLTPTDRNVFLPKMGDITELLWGSTPSDAQGGVASEQPMIIVTDSGIREESNTPGNTESSEIYNRGNSGITNYLQNGEILLTTDYMFEGENIADVADGPVLVADSWNHLDKRIGAQSEIIVNQRTYTTNMRQGCSRIVRLRRPGCFAICRAF